MTSSPIDAGDRRCAGHRRRRRRNGFPADSPYNADLPYDIKQIAVFGEASYDFGEFKLTGGGRYYDFKEERDFISGGCSRTATHGSATRPSRTASARA